MGNHSCKSLSCTAITTATIFPVITILNGSTATISQLPPPLTAAEVMMEHPGYFISLYNSNPNPNYTDSGARHVCSAVPADHELGTKDVYLLLPMHKLNSRLSEQETVFINTVLDSRRTAKSAASAKSSAKSGSTRGKNKFYRRSSSSCCNGNIAAAVSLSKVAPMPRLLNNIAAIEINQEDDLINEELADQFQLQMDMPSSLRRLEGSTMCRSKSWIPKLETISEVAY